MKQVNILLKEYEKETMVKELIEHDIEEIRYDETPLWNILHDGFNGYNNMPFKTIKKMYDKQNDL